MEIPLELLELIERNNVVLILGHAANLATSDQNKLPTLTELAQELASRANYPGDDLNLARVAQHYELEFGRNALLNYVKDRVQTNSAYPLASHQLIAGLPFRVIISTCLDNRLEQALTEAGRPFVRVVQDADVAYEAEDKLLLVKMYGDLEQPESVILTEMDHRRFLSQVSTISDALNRIIASRTLLLLGLDLDDNNFKDLYDRVTRRLDRHARRSYAFYQEASPYAVNWWEKLNNVRVAQANPITFLRQLDTLLQERQGEPTVPSPTTSEEETPTTIPGRPYKFLNAYKQEDTAIFFGRNRENLNLLSKLVSYRLVLFYGKSGVGKTSLIQAGLMPALTTNGYLPVYARILTAPQPALMRAINATLQTPLPESTSLYTFLQQVCQSVDQVLVLFIDQFEELFTQVDPQTRAIFVETLSSIYNDEHLQLKIVLSFREDFLAELNAFVDQIPDIFQNYFRLEQLTLAQAEEAITGPGKLYGFEYEPALVEQLLTDLGAQKIAPPQLQIVCDSLYERLAPNERRITTQHYENLGGASAILTGYLDQVLKRYVSEQRTIIQELLKAFITSADTKAVLTIDLLAQRTRLPVEQVRNMLDELLKARIVRRAESETQYELSHEYLANHIASWIGQEERAIQRAREMLEQGLTKWNSFGIPLYRDEMALINDHRDALDLNQEAITLLVRSAVWSGLATDYWLGQASPQLRVKVLQEAASSDDAIQRERAAILIGQFSVVDLTEVVAALMLADPESVVRGEAALSLAQLDKDYFVSQIEKGLDGSPEQQRTALEAVAKVQDYGLEMPGLDRLARFNLNWRLRWLRLRRNHARRNLFTLYATLGGGISGLAGGLIGSILSRAGEDIPVATIIAIVPGLLLGAAFGFGYGTIEAMGERRNSFLYVIGAALSGGVVGAIIGSGDTRSIYHALVGTGIGFIGGILGGGVIAAIINLTESIKGLTQRLTVRLICGMAFGAIAGILISIGAQQSDVLPYGLPYGIALIMLIPTGIIIATDLAERKLASQTVQANHNKQIYEREEF